MQKQRGEKDDGCKDNIKRVKTFQERLTKIR
nr:MAG TPA: hypothetical protein [Caudoviricetes sp.]